MKDWRGNEVKRNDGQEIPAPAAPIVDVETKGHPIIEDTEARKQYPLCPDCGRRHPLAGGAEGLGKYITYQAIKMSGIRAEEAAATLTKELEVTPTMALVFDRYIDLFVEPEHKDAFIEGLCLGLGSSEAKVKQLEAALGNIETVLSMMETIGNLNARNGKPR